MPTTLCAAALAPTAAGNVTVCAILATVMRTLNQLALPALGMFENASVIDPPVVTVYHCPAA